MAMYQLRAAGQHVTEDALSDLLYYRVLEDIEECSMVSLKELGWSMGFVAGEPAVGVKDVKGQPDDPVDYDREEVG